MELRRTKLIQELREAREDLLNINFATDTSRRVGVFGVSNPYVLVGEWLDKWDPTFNRYSAFFQTAELMNFYVTREVRGYQQEDDAEIFNEIRPKIVGFIDRALSNLDQEQEVEPVLEAYMTLLGNSESC